MVDLRRRAPKNGLEKAIWISKIGFFLVGIVSAGMSARVAVPPAAGVLASALPLVWAALGSWLAPPYLFVVIHLIILVIWKLSDQRQQHHRDVWPAGEIPPAVADVVKIESFEPPPDLPPPPEHSSVPWREISQPPTPAKEIRSFEPPLALHLSPKPSHEAWRAIPKPAPSAESSAPRPPSDASTKAAEEKAEAWSAFEIQMSIEEAVETSEALKEMESAAAAESMDENDSLEATWKSIMEKSPRNGETSAIRQRPMPPPSPAESTVDNDSMEATWKAIIEKPTIMQELRPPPSPAESMENDTMEATWKTITEKTPRNGGKPATRGEPRPPPEPQPASSPAVTKGRLPSVTGREELNRRCDDFIKKRYDQIRLQRHESNQRRLEMMQEIKRKSSLPEKKIRSSRPFLNAGSGLECRLL